MKIDFDVAFGIEIEIEESMPRKQRQHMIEERDAAADGRLPFSVEIETRPDGSFTGCAFDEASRDMPL